MRDDDVDSCSFSGQVETIAAGVGSTVKVLPFAPGVGELAPVDGH